VATAPTARAEREAAAAARDASEAPAGPRWWAHPAAGPRSARPRPWGCAASLVAGAVAPVPPVGEMDEARFRVDK